MADRQIKGTVFSEFGEKTAPAIILIHGLGLNKDVYIKINFSFAGKLKIWPF